MSVSVYREDGKSNGTILESLGKSEVVKLSYSILRVVIGSYYCVEFLNVLRQECFGERWAERERDTKRKERRISWIDITPPAGVTLRPHRVYDGRDER